MKLRDVLIGVVAGCATTVFAATAFMPEQDPADDEMMQAFMEAFEKYGTPGSEHELLAGMVGRWNCEVRHRTAPGATEHVSTGVSEFESIMDGRYIAQHYKGDIEGMPFEGGGLWGYDRMKKKYVSMWVDSMSTAIAHYEGVQKNDQTFEFKGEIPGYSQGKYVPSRTVCRIIDENTWTFEMHMPDPTGTEFKTVTITYRRTE